MNKNFHVSLKQEGKGWFTITRGRINQGRETENAIKSISPVTSSSIRGAKMRGHFDKG